MTDPVVPAESTVPPAAPTTGPASTGPPPSGPSKTALAIGAAGLVVVAVVGTVLLTRDTSPSSIPVGAGTSVSSTGVSAGAAAGSGTTGMSGTADMSGQMASMSDRMSSDMAGMQDMSGMMSNDDDSIVIQYRAPEGGPVITTTMADGEVNFDPPAASSAAAPAGNGATRTVQFVLFGKDGAADVTITTPDGTTTLSGVAPSSDPNSAPADRTLQIASGQTVSMTATRTAGSGSTNCAIIVDGQNVDLSLVTGDGAVARCEATV